MTDGYKGKILPAYSLADLLDQPPPQRPIAINRWLRVGDLVIVTAPPDSFKSTFVMEMSWALATNEDFLGYPHWDVRHPGRVLIIQVEIDPGSYVERFKHFGRTEDIIVVDLGVADIEDFDLTMTDWMRDTLDYHGCDTLILDPIGEMWPLSRPDGSKFSENSNDDVGPVIKGIKRMQRERPGTTVVLVHHDPKAQQGVKNRAAGASFLLRAPDVRIFMDRKGDDKVEVSVGNRLQSGVEPQALRFSRKRRLEVTYLGHTPIDKVTP